MIDLISTVVPVVGALASSVAAVVAVEAVRGGKRQMEDMAIRVGGYADEAHTDAKTALVHADGAWEDRMAVAADWAAVKRERTIVTSIARTSKKHAQDAKAERLRATGILDNAADFAGEAGEHCDAAHDYAQEARGHAGSAGDSAAESLGSVELAAKHADTADEGADAADTSAREAASAADRAEEAAATIEQVL